MKTATQVISQHHDKPQKCEGCSVVAEGTLEQKKQTPACKMRAGRSRRYWHWRECFWCWKNWYNLDLDVNPASAETGTYVSELTWDQCPAGWLQSRHLYADRCQPPCVQPMLCHFLQSLGCWPFKWLVLCKLPVYQWRLELAHETDVCASAQVPAFNYS